MHGVIFTSFRDYLVASHGNGTAAAVFEAEPEYLLGQAYPDESLLRLVALASARTGLEPDEIVFEFGVFTAEITFARLYPAFFDVSPSTREFLLTVETRQESQRTLSLTPIGTFVTLLIYLAIGAGLYTYYAQHPAARLPRPDEIFPFFIRSAMPELLRGLMLSAIVLASIDSPLGSLAASFVTDIYRPLLVPGKTERHYVSVSRAAVIVFGLILAALAYGFSFFDRFLWLAFKIAGVTFGSLLGVFLLGLVTRVRANRANVAAMVIMALVNLALLVLAETGRLALGWSWLVILGTVGTMALAAVLAKVLDRAPAPRPVSP